MSEVEVSVGGRKYYVACNPGEETDVLEASVELNKEANNLIKNIGKVSDSKLLLMAGIMISGRLKSLEKDLKMKSGEFLGLKDEISKIKQDHQNLNKGNDFNTKNGTDEFLKILQKIYNKLNSLKLENNQTKTQVSKHVQTDNSVDEIPDQKELFR